MIFDWLTVFKVRSRDFGGGHKLSVCQSVLTEHQHREFGATQFPERKGERGKNGAEIEASPCGTRVLQKQTKH
jgi:hypothetical protein